MMPPNTYKVLGTRIQHAFVADKDQEYIITGTDLNDLKGLALRFCQAPFDDYNEKRDWENRLNLLCDTALRSKL